MVSPALQGIPHQAAGPAMIVALACDILRGVIEQTLDQLVIDAEFVAGLCRHGMLGDTEPAVIDPPNASGVNGGQYC